MRTSTAVAVLAVVSIPGARATGAPSAAALATRRSRSHPGRCPGIAMSSWPTCQRPLGSPTAAPYGLAVADAWLAWATSPGSNQGRLRDTWTAQAAYDMSRGSWQDNTHG